MVGMLEEWALTGSLGRGWEFSSFVCILWPGFNVAQDRVVAYSNSVSSGLVLFLDCLTRKNDDRLKRR
jgi:hypothetical protein